MERKTPHNYSLYEMSYGQDFPTEQYYIYKFDSFPSKYLSDCNYDISIKHKLEQLNYVLESDILLVDKRTHGQSQKYIYIHYENKIIINLFLSKTSHDVDNLLRVEVHYSIGNGSIEKQLPFIFTKEYKREKKKFNINLLKSYGGNFDVEKFDIYVPDLNLELNYGYNFIKIHDYVLNRLNQKYGKGLVLLHGEPGTGKTTYVRYLTKLIHEKEILYIPPSIATSLCEPSIIQFLMDFRNSILIIEDAETVISDRSYGESVSGVSNILNITDGIMSDCLNIQIIATFNMEKKKIDKALLRKGRLIAEHKFQKLNVEESNKLLKYLNKNHHTEKDMCLSDIYNVDEEYYISDIENKKIGFNSL
jgi:hypothetical protein